MSNPFVKDSMVKIISLNETKKLIGLDGNGRMRSMCNDGKIYRVQMVVNYKKVKLDNDFFYIIDDLEKAESPYKKASIEPKLFDIKNLG